MYPDFSLLCPVFPALNTFALSIVPSSSTANTSSLFILVVCTMSLVPSQTVDLNCKTAFQAARSKLSVSLQDPGSLFLLLLLRLLMTSKVAPLNIAKSTPSPVTLKQLWKGTTGNTTLNSEPILWYRWQVFSLCIDDYVLAYGFMEPRGGSDLLWKPLTYFPASNF